VLAHAPRQPLPWLIFNVRRRSILSEMLYEIIWPEGMQEFFIRSAAACFTKPEGISEAIVKKFTQDMQKFPLEWPTSTRAPSEHVWGAGMISVHYRLIPAKQQIEVLSVEVEPQKKA
jgi:hypothetical protein